jgi:hypothetical protein
MNLRMAGMFKRKSRVFQGVVENSFRKRPRRQRWERAGKEFSKRLWENGGNPIKRGTLRSHGTPADKGFPRFSS